MSFKNYISNLIIFGFSLLFVRTFPYYVDYLREEVQNTLLYIYFAYLILAPIYYYFVKTETNKSVLIIQYLRKLLTWNIHTTKEEKTAILFLLVKLFFTPLMLQFFFQNFHHVKFLLNHFNWFGFALTSIFMIDTFIFGFAYLIELKFLNNIVKSVEPTFLGWFVAIICYPPFNWLIGDHIEWGANDYATFGIYTNFVRVLIIFLILIYLSATFSLGAKASNLTNRGIVTKFPYSIIRHPAYVSKNLMWWITLIPVMSWKFAIGMFFWSFIYYLRAYTEERHLSQDQDYITYKEKIKYKFIPYIY